ncbi:unnamed protein product [Mytilus coruscus]|uniref:CCHC-type domain-containing protein n=1 Tax=Mytilus coruscus TaxID=42192 RepID=A0A6J8A4H9_MYTCO|nr:unnamed protein product [Mytilus coruscus]
MTDRTPRRVQSYTGGRDDLELNPFKIVAGTPSGEVQMRVPLSNLGTRPKSPEIRGKQQFEKLSEEFRVALDGSDSVDILLPSSQPRQLQGRSNCALAASGNEGLHLQSSTDLRGPTLGQGWADAAEGFTEGFQSTGSVLGSVHHNGVRPQPCFCRSRRGNRAGTRFLSAGDSEIHMPNCAPPPHFNENITPIPNTNNYAVNRRPDVPATNKNTYKKPPVYDGTSSWQDYLVQFELLGKRNQWTQEDKAMELGGELLSKVKSKVREKGESLPELAQDVKRLVRFAYPTAGAELRDQLALDCFIDSLGDAEMQWSVHQNGPKSVDHAVSVALKYEAFYASRKKQGMPRPVRAQSEIEAEQNETAVAVRKVEQTLEKLTQLVGAANKNNGQDNYNKCHYCGGQGHFRKNCNKRMKDLENNVRQYQLNQNTNRNAESYNLSGNQTRLE